MFPPQLPQYVEGRFGFNVKNYKKTNYHSMKAGITGVQITIIWNPTKYTMRKDLINTRPTDI